MADETTSPAPIDHRAEAVRWISLSANNGQSPEAAALVALTHAVLALADETARVAREVNQLLPVLAGDGTPLITVQQYS